MPKPTARGISLCLAALGTYISARLLGTWELYFVSFGFFGVAALSWALVWLTSRRFGVSRTLAPESPAAGDPLWFTFVLTSRSLLPGVQVTLPDAMGGLGGVSRVEFDSLGPRGERRVTSGPYPARRGRHPLPRLRAAAEDPLGLVRRRRDLGGEDELVVYPKLVRLTSCVLLQDGMREWGAKGLPTVGGTEFRGVRPHYPGEPLNHVDWKSTAKTGTLMLREMDHPRGDDVAVLLDRRAAAVVGTPPDTNFELAVKAAGSLADFALRSGSVVRLLLQGVESRQESLSADLRGRRRLLESLADVEPEAAPPLGASLQALLRRRGTLAHVRSVTLVALSLDRDLARALLVARRSGLQASLIVVERASFQGDDADRAGDRDGQSLLVSLSAAGVTCLNLRRGDDLAAALSAGQPGGSTPDETARTPARPLFSGAR